jgi:hypothetical protein
VSSSRVTDLVKPFAAEAITSQPTVGSSSVKLFPAIDVSPAPSWEIASMIAMVNEKQIRQLAQECIHISDRTGDACTASEMLRLSYRILQLATPTMPAWQERVPRTRWLSAPPRRHEDHAGRRTSREIVDRQCAIGLSDAIHPQSARDSNKRRQGSAHAWNGTLFA